MSQICQGVNVLEIGAGSAAASMAGMVLADAGARVWKVEPPEGDRLRRTKPSGFLVWNRGKESVVVDLRTRAGQQQFRGLAADADVVIEGFAPGTTRSWGIDAQALRGLHPHLVHVAITGFGATGPYSKIKASDALVAAKVGIWSRGSFSHRAGASVAPVAWGSYGAAMQAVAGILGALLVRDRTGRGQALDATLVSGLDPIDYFVTTIVQLMAKRGEVPKADSRTTTQASRFGVLVATRDGRFIQTSTLLPHQGKALSQVAGIAVLLDDPRYAGLPTFKTPEDAQAWEDLLLEAFRARDLAYWLPRLEANADIAFELARTCEEGLDHPQILHNCDAITIEDTRHGPVRQVGPIGHFSRSPIAPRASAPALGHHAGPLVPASRPTAAPDAPAHPFSGTTIVEFGCFYAMPYAITMAAALGARVIKLEDGKGDPYRQAFGPEVASNKSTAGKESLSLDLQRPEGQAIARKLIAQADVFVTGFRSGVAEKLGLGHDALVALNPRLLYVHAAGYGSDGPYAHRALYAQAAQAVAGSFGRQVGAWSDPARNLGMSVMELQAVVLPRLGQVVDGDSNAALGLLAAMALGIFHQRRTGIGQRLETSMIAGNAWAYSDDFCAYRGKPAMALCDDEYFGTSALDRAYPTADDGWIYLDVDSQAEFERLARALERPELTRDPRFADAAARAANDDALIGTFEAHFAKQPALAWETLLVGAKVGCAAVSMQGQGAFVAFDPDLQATGLTTRFEHPIFGEMVRAAPPVSFSETPGRVADPCFRGQHNRSILTEFGYRDDEIAGFEAHKVIFPLSGPGPR